MALTRGYKQLLAEARERIETINVDSARSALGSENAVFVDIRDASELEREGMVPGAVHAPRGMLEFMADPDSPYHKPAFASGKRLILYCQSGGRSALAAATLKDMGVANVCHVDGGFAAWRNAGCPTAPKEAGG